MYVDYAAVSSVADVSAVVSEEESEVSAEVSAVVSEAESKVPDSVTAELPVSEEAPDLSGSG